MGPLDHIVQATGCCNREGRLYQEGVNTDKHGIMNCANVWIFLRWPFRFKLIDDGTVPLVVRYFREVPLVNDLLRHLQTPGALLGGEARLLLRRLHPVKDLNDVAIDPETLVI